MMPGDWKRGVTRWKRYPLSSYQPDVRNRIDRYQTWIHRIGRAKDEHRLQLHRRRPIRSSTRFASRYESRWQRRSARQCSQCSHRSSALSRAFGLAPEQHPAFVPSPNRHDRAPSSLPRLFSARPAYDANPRVVDDAVLPWTAARTRILRPSRRMNTVEDVVRDSLEPATTSRPYLVALPDSKLGVSANPWHSLWPSELPCPRCSCVSIHERRAISKRHPL